MRSVRCLPNRQRPGRSETSRRRRRPPAGVRLGTRSRAARLTKCVIEQLGKAQGGAYGVPAVLMVAWVGVVLVAAADAQERSVEYRVHRLGELPGPPGRRRHRAV